MTAQNRNYGPGIVGFEDVGQDVTDHHQLNEHAGVRIKRFACSDAPSGHDGNYREDRYEREREVRDRDQLKLHGRDTLGMARRW